MDSNNNEHYNPAEKISISDSLNAVNMWLNSADVEITDHDGNIKTGYRVNSKPCALLKRMLPYIESDQTK
jgi:hypothetical protein